MNIAAIVAKILGSPRRSGTRKDGQSDDRPLGRYVFHPHQGKRERLRRMTQILTLRLDAPYDVYLTVRESYERGLTKMMHERKMQ